MCIQQNGTHHSGYTQPSRTRGILYVLVKVEFRVYHHSEVSNILFGSGNRTLNTNVIPSTVLLLLFSPASVQLTY